MYVQEAIRVAENVSTPPKMNNVTLAVALDEPNVVKQHEASLTMNGNVSVVRQ
ncbi:uncharacterized protein PITG_12801 [Phytophthora infestans T30-4]|uniref:Uncharacterized protein n=1 Tax=Phytophthora infestans (strain T30-4) TaxID=403677 RepID=D0NL71_PHYIT|nr:uncharacterized protein PITG_12801 [Phytophthora infestans T30-4]EEY60389.1 hypothetical protein PITG_12801 [Phytophthora infestans T30-4]|eukprot:XP_002900185.1 hypothetical protein PITG_12801 [Phytophthora infestans T30-4]